MGPGWWLDPITNTAYEVSRHEIWAANQQNLEKVGISNKWREVISQFDPNRDADEIRLAAIRAGLVRIRAYKNHVTAQFHKPRKEVRETIWAIANFLLPKVGQHTDILIHNLAVDDKTQMSLQGLLQKLRSHENILVSEAEGEDIADVRSNAIIEHRLDAALKKVNR